MNEEDYFQAICEDWIRENHGGHPVPLEVRCTSDDFFAIVSVKSGRFMTYQRCPAHCFFASSHRVVMATLGSAIEKCIIELNWRMGREAAQVP